MTPFHLVLCPGFHSPRVTQELRTCLSRRPFFQGVSILELPTQSNPWAVLSAYEIRQFLYASLDLPSTQSVPSDRLVFLAFSAGCVGATAAAHHWHLMGGQVAALFAADGWGVPVAAPFPVYRLSHDRFTHQTSQWLGSQPINFYADPSVPHLRLWQAPSDVLGWQATHQRRHLLAAQTGQGLRWQRRDSEPSSTSWSSLEAGPPGSGLPTEPVQPPLVAMTALDFIEEWTANVLA